MSIGSVIWLFFWCGDLLEGRLVYVELYEGITFIHLFNNSDLTVQIIYRRMRNDSVMISRLVKDVGELIVANTNYGISMQIQRKATGNPP
jgi:hypothetical protein